MNKSIRRFTELANWSPVGKRSAKNSLLMRYHRRISPHVIRSGYIEPTPDHSVPRFRNVYLHKKARYFFYVPKAIGVALRPTRLNWQLGNKCKSDETK